MKTIDTYNFSNKKAIIRVDFNVPLNDKFEVTDNTRIKAALPTIKKILEDGGSVILMSHLGRPKNGPENKFSLQHIVPELESLLGRKVEFVEDCVGESVKQKVASLAQGSVLLLENLRFHKEETQGDKDFAKQLASLADVYVNDAFGTAHRAHASTAIITEFFPEEKLFGYLIQNELNSIDKVMHNAEKPFTAIIGGAKVSSKIEIITQLLSKVDNIIIGGGMSYTFAKALGGKVGNSLVEDDYLATAKQILDEAKSNGKQIFIPTDTVVADAFDNNAKTKVCSINEIEDGWMGLDIGAETIEKYKEVLINSKTILWNGPMGVFEMSNFEKGTKEVALAVAEATKNGAYSLVGGGDSVAAINKYNMANNVSYVSTGGGALLEYMEGKELPGIAAIRK